MDRHGTRAYQAPAAKPVPAFGGAYFSNERAEVKHFTAF
jgi:hypothetical protein